ncbi:unannotated protein [freshwater metagenome]|uniref:Unannotated protein n=1 Tax=freshwater metagenome TaxID=449393 RepID=A0A6J7I258_9ZZZZ|nr:hypothetical protein [Actinomycetota bacterium]
MSDRITDLLHEVTDDVEPGDRLDAIRAEIGVRRPRRGWWAASGAGLVAASVATAMALSTGGTPQVSVPDPATSTMAIYYVGDTPDGPRLFREFRRLGGDPLATAVSAAVGRTGAAGPPLAPLDPDYRVPWPPMTDATARVVPFEDRIEVDLGGDVEGSLRDRGALTSAEAGLAVEQLVRTAQGAVGERLPVRFLLYGEITDQVLGVPTSEELAVGSDLATLAHVSLSDPSEGQQVDNDEPFTVKGVGNSFEGTIVTRIQRLSGVVEVVAEQPAIAGTYQDRLFPFGVTFDLTTVPPGDYLVVSRTDDPSSEGRVHVDDRRITIVD